MRASGAAHHLAAGRRRPSCPYQPTLPCHHHHASPRGDLGARHAGRTATPCPGLPVHPTGRPAGSARTPASGAHGHGKITDRPREGGPLCDVRTRDSGRADTDTAPRYTPAPACEVPARGPPRTRPLPDEPPPLRPQKDMLHLHEVSMVSAHPGGGPGHSERWRVLHPMDHACQRVCLGLRVLTPVHRRRPGGIAWRYVGPPGPPAPVVGRRVAEPRHDQQMGAGLTLERASADKRPSRPSGAAKCRERWPADLQYRVRADRWTETW